MFLAFLFGLLVYVLVTAHDKKEFSESVRKSEIIV